MCCFLFFFFQAEDGIRDGTVTGVQTCALPIYGGRAVAVLEALIGQVFLATLVARLVASFRGPADGGPDGGEPADRGLAGRERPRRGLAGRERPGRRPSAG